MIQFGLCHLSAWQTLLRSRFANCKITSSRLSIAPPAQPKNVTRASCKSSSTGAVSPLLPISSEMSEILLLACRIFQHRTMVQIHSLVARSACLYRLFAALGTFLNRAMNATCWRESGSWPRESTRMQSHLSAEHRPLSETGHMKLVMVLNAESIKRPAGHRFVVIKVSWLFLP